MQHQTDTRFPDAAAADYDRRILTPCPAISLPGAADGDARADAAE